MILRDDYGFELSNGDGHGDGPGQLNGDGYSYSDGFDNGNGFGCGLLKNYSFSGGHLNGNGGCYPHNDDAIVAVLEEEEKP